MIFHSAFVSQVGKRSDLIFSEAPLARHFALPFTPHTEMDEFQHHFGHAQGLIDTAEAALLQQGANFMEIRREESDQFAAAMLVAASHRCDSVFHSRFYHRSTPR